MVARIADKGGQTGRGLLPPRMGVFVNVLCTGGVAGDRTTARGGATADAARPRVGTTVTIGLLLALLVVLCAVAPAAGAAKPQDLSDVDFVSERVGWAIGTPSAIYKTTDGGKTWRRQKLGGTLWLTAGDFSDARHGWVTATLNEGKPAVILRTTNGGRTWSHQTNPVPTCDVFTDLEAISNSRAVIVGRIGTILRTTNGGATWVPVPSGLVPGAGDIYWPSLSAIDFPTWSVGYGVGSGGRVLKSTDGGASWSKLSSGTTRDLRGVRFVSRTRGWAVGAGGLILRTTDGGATWLPQKSETAKTLIGVDFVSRYHGWVVGANGTILRTSNGGRKWVRQRSRTTGTLVAVDFRTRKKGWVVGDKWRPSGTPSMTGLILRTANGGKRWIREM